MQYSATGARCRLSFRFLIALFSLLLWTPCVTSQQTNGEFRRGDCLVDGHVNMADAVRLIDHLFNAGVISCDDACDGNDDGIIDVQDLIAIVNHITAFNPMPPPVGDCDFDPTDDSLFCDVGCDPPVVPATSPDHTIKLVLVAKSPTQLQLALTFDTPDPLLGFTFGVCHDPNFYQVDTVTEGVDLNQNLPDFYEIVITPAGWTLAALMSALNAQVFPAGTDLGLFDVQYILGPQTPPTSEICPCDSLGEPEMALHMVTQSGTSVLPGVECVVPVIFDPSFFMRGDCNGDGGFNVADAVFLLGYLFVLNVPLPCADACDVNDDGALDISDPVNFLTHLFVGGAAPAPPNVNTGCGADPTPDDPLECTAGTCP